MKPAKKQVVYKRKVAVLIIVGVLILIAASGVFFIKNKLNKIQYNNETPLGSTCVETVSDQQDKRLKIDISDLKKVDAVLAPEGSVIGEDNILNILILGTDERTFELSEDARADCIMILSLNFDSGEGKIISLERGMGVVMYGGMFEGKTDLLTHCFRWGGANLMLEEVQEYFKVDVDKYVRFNFNALVKAVDALGGVDIELSELEAFSLNDAAGKYTFDSGNIQTDFKEGMNHLYGPAALLYARTRRFDSDWVRIGRQRNLVQACFDSLKDADVKTLNSLCDEVLPMIETNFSQMEILQLLLKAPKFWGVKLEQLTIPVDRETMGGVETFTGGGAFAPDYELNAEVIHEFLYGTA